MTLRTLRLVRAGEAAGDVRGVCESGPHVTGTGTVQYCTGTGTGKKTPWGAGTHNVPVYCPYHPCVHVSVCPVCPLCVPAPPFLQTVNKA